jgi:hypothetical protein
MEVRRSEELAGLAQGLYAAMGSGTPMRRGLLQPEPAPVFLGTDRSEFWTD